MSVQSFWVRLITFVRHKLNRKIAGKYDASCIEKIRSEAEEKRFPVNSFHTKEEFSRTVEKLNG